MRAVRILCALAVMLVTGSSGCVLEQTRDLLTVSATFYPSYAEVSRINFSQSESEMAAEGYTVNVYPSEWDPPGAAYDNGAEIFRKGDFLFHIASWTYGGSQNALASGFYNASNGPYKTEADSGAARKYVRSEIEALASRLNFTMDWDQVKWAVDLGPVK